MATNEATNEESKDFADGLSYLGQRFVGGAVGSVEGIWDFVAGGIAELIGAHDWKMEQLDNTWMDYNAADDWFQPNDAWRFAGDVASGIGNSLPCTEPEHSRKSFARKSACKRV